jgi:hypothetical protein
MAYESFFGKKNLVFGTRLGVFLEMRSKQITFRSAPACIFNALAKEHQTLF